MKASERRFFQDPSIFLSNSIGELAEALKEKLFFSGGHPFDRRLVIVPSLAVRRFLENYFVEDPELGIAAGVEILPLAAAMNELLLTRQPTSIELTFQIEAILREFATQNDEQLRPLKNYLAGGEEERVHGLSEELSELFLGYGRLGGEVLERWKKEEGWQQRIWKRCFAPHAPWIPLAEALAKAEPTGFSLYLFHFSALPSPLLDFFNRCRASYFLFSPSQLFWGDVCSEREKASLHRFLEKKGKAGAALDELLQEQNPLFANLAKGGKGLHNALLDAELETEELYREQTGGTLLHALQKELFLNSSSERAERTRDDSIQIHAASSRLREVELLYDTLLKLIHKGVKPEEISVLAPDISLYFSFIQHVFAVNASPIGFSIYDLPNLYKNRCIHGVELLLSLCERRFDLDSVVQLFAFSPFAKKFDLEGDHPLFRRWAEKAHVRWGVDREMRSHFLGEHAMGEGTWDEGFGRLLFGLGMIEHEQDISPQKDEIEKLGILIKLIYDLKRDLAPMMHEGRRAVSKWLNHLRMLMDSYFVFEAEENRFLSELDALSDSCSHLVEPLPFQSVISLLKKQLFQKKSASHHAGDPYGVRFGNLQEGAALPARVVYLLGMEEEAFPRKNPHHSLCALPASQSKPSDEDRYLFLELLFTASDFFIVSFPNSSPEDGKKLLPSLVVQELLSYLSLELVQEHPHLPSDPDNFVNHESVSWIYYVAAAQREEKPSLFVPHFFEKTALLPPKTGAFTIDLKQLRQLAKNPLRFYFNQTLDFFLPWEKEETEFSLSSLEHVRLTQRAWKEPLSPLLRKAEARGIFPQGAFGNLAQSKLVQEGEEIRTFISTDTLEIEWKEGCKTAQEWKKGCWIVPALKWGEVTLTGTLSEISTQGLLLHGKESFADILKAWPDILFFSLFMQKNEVQLLFLKEKTRKNFQLRDPLSALKKYVQYYLLAQENPSPLFPDWAEPLLRGTEEELTKKIAVEQRDPYRRWLLERDGTPFASAIFNNWVPTLRTLLEDVHEF